MSDSFISNHLGLNTKNTLFWALSGSVLLHVFIVVLGPTIDFDLAPEDDVLIVEIESAEQFQPIEEKQDISDPEIPERPPQTVPVMREMIPELEVPEAKPLRAPVPLPPAVAVPTIEESMSVDTPERSISVPPREIPIQPIQRSEAIQRDIPLDTPEPMIEPLDDVDQPLAEVPLPVSQISPMPTRPEDVTVPDNPMALPPRTKLNPSLQAPSVAATDIDPVQPLAPVPPTALPPSNVPTLAPATAPERKPSVRQPAPVAPPKQSEAPLPTVLPYEPDAVPTEVANDDRQDALVAAYKEQVFESLNELLNSRLGRRYCALTDEHRGAKLRVSVTFNDQGILTGLNVSESSGFTIVDRCYLNLIKKQNDDDKLPAPPVGESSFTTVTIPFVFR